jgi:hypothetical protein
VLKWAAGVGVALLSLLMVAHVQAAEPVPTSAKDGLFISPVREYVTTDPKIASTHTVTVANHSDKPMMVSLSLLKFTVTDYNYNYEFKETDEQWVHFAQNNFQLAAGKSQVVSYTLQPPSTAEPGGHYFSAIVTASLDGGKIQTKLQTALMLYVTVKGNLRQSTQIKTDSIPHVAFGDIQFNLTAQNTGNTHVFTFLYGQLEGVSAKPKTSEVGHLLMPGTLRTFSGVIPAPLLPGVYKALYGYTTDAGQRVEKTTWVVYIPVWSIAVLIGVVVGAIVIVRAVVRRRRAKQPY